MIAKLIDFIRSKMGVKEWLIVAGILLIIVAISTGIWWLMIGTAFCAGPKVFEETAKKLGEVDQKAQKQEDIIEKQKEKQLEQISKEEAAAKAKEALQEAAREEANKELPKTKTAEELEDLILDDIDRAGRD